jgi:N-sulfoglucosamine sulfohydrolase
MVNAHDPHRPFDNRVPADKRVAKPVETKETKNKKGTKKKKKKPRQPYPAPSQIYQPNEVVIPGFVPDLPKIREEIAQYYSSARRADDVVGAVLKVLDKFGLRDSTIVVFKSDHGIPIPFAKTNVWRNSTRTPWIVRWPDTVKPNSHDTEHMIAGVDLAPTLLDALGVKPMKGMDGRSFLPVLKGEKQSGRDTVYTHINTIASKRDYTMRSVQDKRYGYIWNGWADGKTTFRNESQAGLTWKAMVAASANDRKIAARVKHFSMRCREEFYDYEKDPDALVNLIDDPKHAARIKDLRAKLLEYMKTTNDIALKKFKATVN